MKSIYLLSGYNTVDPPLTSEVQLDDCHGNH